MEITNSQKWSSGDDVIEIQLSDTEEHFAMRMVVNGNPSDWTFHRPPHGGGTEVTGQNKNGDTFAYYSEYWTGYFPVNTVVRLVPVTKV
jgi:hypothetical protein